MVRYNPFYAIYIIAINTLREIIRDRILYGLLVFAFLLIGLSLVLGQLTFDEQVRISTDLGFTAIQLSGAIIAIFVGSTLVSREVEKKTILTLLVRPITRSQFIVGKTLGLLGIIVIVSHMLGLMLGLTLVMLGIDLTAQIYVGVYGIVLESAVLLAFTIFFGSFASPMLAVSFSIGIFLIGHWVGSLKFFAEKSTDETFKMISQIITGALPNLEKFNWRSLFVYNDPINMDQIMWHSFYAILWVFLLTSISNIIFSRRDLG
jgi:Cu-processing system permease protein